MQWLIARLIAPIPSQTNQPQFVPTACALYSVSLSFSSHKMDDPIKFSFYISKHPQTSRMIIISEISKSKGAQFSGHEFYFKKNIYKTKRFYICRKASLTTPRWRQKLELFIQKRQLAMIVRIVGKESMELVVDLFWQPYRPCVLWSLFLKLNWRVKIRKTYVALTLLVRKKYFVTPNHLALC